MKIKLILLLALFGLATVGFADEAKPDITCEVTVVEMWREAFEHWVNDPANAEVKKQGGIRTDGTPMFDGHKVLSEKEVSSLLKYCRENEQVCHVWTLPLCKTKSGEECEASKTQEIKYPTEYDKGSPPKPTAWEDKKVGVFGTIRPTLGDDGVTFDMQIELHSVALIALISYAPDLPMWLVWQRPQDGMRDDIPKEKIQKLLEGELGVMQPVFNTRKLKTNISIWTEPTVAVVWAYWQPSQMGVLSGNINAVDYKDPDPERQSIRMVIVKPRLAK